MNDDNLKSFRSFDDLLKELRAPGISLAEARALEIPHGPLRQVKYKWSRRGMAVDDLEIHEYILTWTDGGASFRYRNSQGSLQRTVTEKQYRVREDTADEVLAIVERENLIAWSKMKVDPDRQDSRFQPVDTTWSSSLSLAFRKPEEEGEMTVGISTEAAKQEGGGDVISALADLLRGFVRDEALLSEKTERSEENPSPMMGFFIQPNAAPASSSLTCPVCGAPEKPGKFCPECGAPKLWFCPLCGTENKRRFCTECGQKRP